MNNIESLKRELEHEEGKREAAYLDSEGHWHIGIGHLLNEQTDAELAILGLEDDLDNWDGFVISEDQIYQLLDHDIGETMRSLRNAFEDEVLESLDPKRFMAAFQMCYQIGSVTGFPAFCNAVRDGRWEDAANEMMWRDGTVRAVRSRWYRQTPKRCQAMADLMNYGSQVKQDPVVEIQESLKAHEITQISNEDLISEIARRFNS